jgi:hypothetical protein
VTELTVASELHSRRNILTVQEAPLMDGIDSVIGSDMADTVFMDPADLLI